MVAVLIVVQWWFYGNGTGDNEGMIMVGSTVVVRGGLSRSRGFCNWVVLVYNQNNEIVFAANENSKNTDEQIKAEKNGRSRYHSSKNFSTYIRCLCKASDAMWWWWGEGYVGCLVVVLRVCWVFSSGGLLECSGADVSECCGLVAMVAVLIVVQWWFYGNGTGDNEGMIMVGSTVVVRGGLSRSRGFCNWVVLVYNQNNEIVFAANENSKNTDEQIKAEKNGRRCACN
ncbi:unnamed protein product [Ilex paraguariensis]|uniref:Transmembrane protein n=1 Tax=Ilex paraguariensis TaxID=185542 RepID=A0ABC8RK60_9AQUA